MKNNKNNVVKLNELLRVEAVRVYSIVGNSEKAAKIMERRNPRYQFSAANIRKWAGNPQNPTKKYDNKSGGYQYTRSIRNRAIEYFKAGNSIAAVRRKFKVGCWNTVRLWLLEAGVPMPNARGSLSMQNGVANSLINSSKIRRIRKMIR